MRKLEYRRPRRPVSFTVEFLSNGEILRGLCRDVTDAGLRVDFDGRAIIGTSGTLTLRHPTRVFSIKATIAYLDNAHTVLTFLFDTPQERGTAAQFFTSIAPLQR